MTNKNPSSAEKTQQILITEERVSKSIIHGNIPTEKRVKIQLYNDTDFALQTRSVNVEADQILGSRQTQQDCYAISEDVTAFTTANLKAWAVVCDGMGGMASGELASSTTTEIMKEILSSPISQDSIYEVLLQGVRFAGEEVKKISAGIDGTSGTTIVCVVIKNNDLYYLSVGDSRIYIARGNEFMQVNRDHNYFLELSEMVKNGEITAEEAANDPQKDALISYVGIDNMDIIDINKNPVKLAHNDIILLCSDGLTKVLNDSEIHEIIKAGNYNMQEILNSLLVSVQTGNVRSLDNTTIALLHYTETD